MLLITSVSKLLVTTLTCDQLRWWLLAITIAVGSRKTLAVLVGADLSGFCYIIKTNVCKYTSESCFNKRVTHKN